jgi:hypothetical protein
MWIIQEPNKVALLNRRHFVETKNGDYAECLKYSIQIFVEYVFKMQRLEVSGAVRHIYIYIYVVRRLKVKWQPPMKVIQLPPPIPGTEHFEHHTVLWTYLVLGTRGLVSYPFSSYLKLLFIMVDVNPAHGLQAGEPSFAGCSPCSIKAFPAALHLHIQLMYCALTIIMQWTSKPKQSLVCI